MIFYAIRLLPILIITGLVHLESFAQRITRGPYLNAVTDRSAVIRWRTDKAVKGLLVWSAEGMRFDKKIKEKIRSTEHEIKAADLIPGTKYYYRTASARDRRLTVDSAQFFRTAPLRGSQEPVRIWALGDFGNGSKNQYDCYRAMLSIAGDHLPDAWIWLGDNAYDAGRDDEYQKNVFEVYGRSFFQHTPIYPSPGNHDYKDKRENGASEIAYYKLFTVPKQGEGGGVPSGTSAYYSFDYGNVHLVSLNSEEETENGFAASDTLSNQVTWLKKDLEENRNTWTVVYLHRPPYTGAGSHNADIEKDLIALRKNLVPVLERYKVDLVIAGHSHVYERTYPLVGHYGPSNTFDPEKHIARYPVSGSKSQRGIVYIVAGSGGQIDNNEKGIPHPATAHYNNDIGGSLLLDFSANRLDGRWVSATGEVRDSFFIEK